MCLNFNRDFIRGTFSSIKILFPNQRELAFPQRHNANYQGQQRVASDHAASTIPQLVLITRLEVRSLPEIQQADVSRVKQFCHQAKPVCKCNRPLVRERSEPEIKDNYGFACPKMWIYPQSSCERSS